MPLMFNLNMKATRIFSDRLMFADSDFAELVIWKVPSPVPPSTHGIKYRVSYIVVGMRVIGFDNERGKGDHRHDGGVESPYSFTSPERLIEDFKKAIRDWRTAHGKD